MMKKAKRALSAILSFSLAFSALFSSVGTLSVAADTVERTDDSFTRTLPIRTDMVHDNPGGNPYVTQYDDCEFLSLRGLTGKVFFLSEAAQLAIDWQDYDPDVFPVGSNGYKYVQNKKTELHQKYGEAKDEGLKVYFMMDFISLPSSMKTLYGDAIMTNGKIDINKAKTQEVMKEMMKEIFTEFPEVDGFYLRYGESYVGYYSSYHFGNNPIAVSGTKAEDHTTLLKFFRDEVCEKYGKDVIYRTWSTETGSNSFTTSKTLYLQVTDAVEPSEHLYLAIKHTAGDFWRNYTFNETIGVGKHQQIIEIQCSREYEGKGSFPNYVAGNVINGFPEYEWQMAEDANKCLRDVVNCEDSLIAGIWTWSRGGGWGGPYINGTEVPEGEELWSDLNAYVLHQWAQDTSVKDTYLVKKYAKEVLGMDDTDAANFVRFAELSADAVLNGIGTNCAPAWDPQWTRDASTQKSQFESNLQKMYTTRDGDKLPKLEERRLAVADYEEMLSIADGFSDGVAMKPYIQLTTKYGWYLFSIWERMWTAGVLYMDRNYNGVKNADEINEVIDDFYDLWSEWEKLKADNEACPSLYDKSMCVSIIETYRCSDEPWEDDRPDGPDKNYALNAAASSKFVDSHFPKYAVDGDKTTRWGTPTDTANRSTQWLLLDLGKSVRFDTVVIQWEATVSCAKEYYIQVSQDGVNFTDVYHETNGQGGTETITFAPVSARYVRMQGVKEKGSYGYSIYEFEIYNKGFVPTERVEMSENYAAHKTATASYQHNAFAPSYATDGDNDNSNKDTTKRWNGGNRDEACWIMVDLGESKTFDMVKLFWNLKNCPKGYEVQVSEDASAWTKVTAYTGGLINSGSYENYILTHSFDEVTARYVRVYVPKESRASDTQNWASLVEFEVYDKTVIKLDVPGDIDLDGLVGATDLTLLARHVSQIEEIIDVTALQNADMDGKDGIGADDLTALARKVAQID